MAPQFLLRVWVAQTDSSSASLILAALGDPIHPSQEMGALGKRLDGIACVAVSRGQSLQSGYRAHGLLMHQEAVGLAHGCRQETPGPGWQGRLDRDSGAARMEDVGSVPMRVTPEREPAGVPAAGREGGKWVLGLY